MATSAVIAGVRTPIHASMLWAAAKSSVSLPWKAFTFAVAFFGLSLDRVWLAAALRRGSGRRKVHRR